MTVATTNSKAGPYAGAGTAGPFTVDFRFLENAHLRVVKSLRDGSDVDLVLDSDYAVSGAGADAGAVTLTAALVSGEKLTIVRNVPATQEADYVQNDAFPAQSHEESLDKLTMIAQQLAEGNSRTLKLSVSTPSGVSSTVPSPLPNHLIGWNQTGTQLQNMSPGTLATVVAFGTSKADIFTGDGVETEFYLTWDPGAEANLDVAVGGVTQLPDIDYSWAGGLKVTFASAPPIGAKILVRYFRGLPQGSTDSAASAFAPGDGGPDTNVQSALRALFKRTKGVRTVKDFDCAVDGVTDDRAKLITAMAECAAAGDLLVVTPGISPCSDWLPLPSGLKMIFLPGAQWKLTGVTEIGGFVCGGYDINLNQVPFADVDIEGISLDCSSIAGENGFNAINADVVRVRNPKIYNVLHSPVKLGGRAFQFEGAVVDGVHVFSPYLENCSIGINSQGASSGVEVVRNITYHDVVMRNVDVPFNIDSQFPNPELNTLNTMSTTVVGAHLYNCGKITWPGDTSSGIGGGIVCGDRGHGLKISGLRVLNSPGYGQIGGLVHGTMFDVHLSDVQITTAYTAPFDFGVLGFGSPGAVDMPSTVFTDRVSCKGNMDYVVKAGGPGVRIGAACLRGVEIDGPSASLAGIMDSHAGSLSGPKLELILSDSGFASSGLQSLSDLYAAGNTIGVCQPVQSSGPWMPTDASGAGLAFVVSGTPWYERRGRSVVAMCSIVYPATSNTANAMIGGLPFPSANFSSYAGNVDIGYKTEVTLSAGYVIGGTATAILTSESGPVQNVALSGDTVMMTFTYLATQ